MLRPIAIALFAACLLFACAPPARADAVVITSGMLSAFPMGVDPTFNFNIAGQGLAAIGHAEGFKPNLSAGLMLAPGSTFNLAGTAVVNGNIPVSAVLASFNGMTYQNVSFLGTTFNFSALTLTLPAAGVFNFTLSAPFTMAGTLTARELGAGPVLFTTEVSGAGVASVRFFFFAGAYHVDNITYNFAPTAVPEPATLLLLSAGLACAVGAARRRRKAQA